MNIGRTFDRRIRELRSEKVDPVLMIPVLELLEETLLQFQSDVTGDKQIEIEEKGRLVTLLTPLLRSLRAARDQWMAGHAAPNKSPQPKLHNAHLA
jgi:hypothetical protein